MRDLSGLRRGIVTAAGAALLGWAVWGASVPGLPRFRDVTADAGVGFVNSPSKTSRKYLIESMVGGVAVLDYDGDGLLDLYFVNGAKLEDPMPPGKDPDKSDARYWNRLYRNLGGFRFEDVTAKAGVAGSGYGMGAAAGDFDNDGHPDLYVTNYGRNILYRNNGDGTFTDVTGSAGVEGGGWSAHAVFFDYDGDGLPDLLVSRYVVWDFSRDDWCGERKPGYRAYCHPDHYAPIPHLLYRNLGGGKFEDVSKKSGIGESPGKGLGVALNDHDGNGWVDVAIANDSFPQQFFRNNGDGTFTEDGLLSGMAYDADGNTYAGMGIDFADYDNDGRPDVFVNALANQKYALYRASEAGFDYVTGPSGVGAITMLHSGWGTRFVDYDNDGWRDLFVVQGHVMDNIELTQPSVRYLEPPVLMRNVKGRFEDVSKSSGEPFGVAIAGRGAAFADLDNDGYVDVAINVNEGPAILLRNEGGSGNHWLGLRLTGSKSNRDAVGAVVRIEPEQGPAQTGMVSAAGSYLSSNDPRLHFGLGPAKSVKRLEIRWPSGARQVLEDVAADRYLEVSEP